MKLCLLLMPLALAHAVVQPAPRAAEPVASENLVPRETEPEPLPEAQPLAEAEALPEAEPEAEAELEPALLVRQVGTRCTVTGRGNLNVSHDPPADLRR